MGKGLKGGFFKEFEENGKGKRKGGDRFREYQGLFFYSLKIKKNLINFIKKYPISELLNVKVIHSLSTPPLV